MAACYAITTAAEVRLSCPQGIAHGNATLIKLIITRFNWPTHFTISLDYSYDSSRLRRGVTAQQLAIIDINIKRTIIKSIRVFYHS